MRESTKKTADKKFTGLDSVEVSTSTKKALPLISDMPDRDEVFDLMRNKAKRVAKKTKSKKKTNERHVPTKRTRCAVADLAAFGHTQDEIAKFIGITKPTLEKYYRIELDHAATFAVVAVENVLYKNCMLGREKSIFFFLKNRGGNRWNEAEGDDPNAKLAELVEAMRGSIKDAAT